MKLTWRTIVLGAALMGAILYGIRSCQSERAARIVAELQLSQQKQLNDSTEARLAIASVDKHELGAALDAAHALNGKLIAALKIKVPAHDTTVIHDSITTILHADSTRTAEFRDSTFAGTLAVALVAPPCCAPLGVTYTLHRPAFEPTVSFVRVGDTTVATVTWQGEKLKIVAPFAKFPKQLHTLGYYVESRYWLLDKSFQMEAGGILRLGQTFQVKAGVTTGKDGFIALHKEF